VNEKRLEFLEKKVKLLDIATRGRDRYTPSETKDILNVINEFDDALTLLDDYDHRTLNKVEGIISEQKITYEDCLGIIYTLKFNEKSDLFGLQRDKGLESIINNIYQTYDGLDIYKSVEEKAANFLYFIVKNHVFIDGNKRIAATLFIYFLFYYDILYKDDKKIIENNTLVALTLLIAESNPKEKNIIIDLIMNFLV
ncbi:MAG: Fic family protein, partial [Bacilli bacterium]|nr:Fic family protein [Bacilli bacterium]